MNIMPVKGCMVLQYCMSNTHCTTRTGYWLMKPSDTHTMLGWVYRHVPTLHAGHSNAAVSQYAPLLHVPFSSDQPSVPSSLDSQNGAKRVRRRKRSHIKQSWSGWLMRAQTSISTAAHQRKSSQWTCTWLKWTVHRLTDTPLQSRRN